MEFSAATFVKLTGANSLDDEDEGADELDFALEEAVEGLLTLAFCLFAVVLLPFLTIDVIFVVGRLLVVVGVGVVLVLLLLVVVVVVDVGVLVALNLDVVVVVLGTARESSFGSL